jgi:hypothetical protein
VTDQPFEHLQGPEPGIPQVSEKDRVRNQPHDRTGTVVESKGDGVEGSLLGQAAV